jgi:predicted flap endonuclease-1-like 5' DNA nuclease
MALDGQDKAGLDSAVIGRWLLALAAGLLAGLAVWWLTPYHPFIALGLGLVLAALVFILLSRLGIPYSAAAAAPQVAPLPQVAPVSSAQAAETLLARAREAAPVVEPDRVKGDGAATRPATLNAARGGLADDLKIIKGIGPKLEQMCQRMGYFHFDQIALWTEAEVAWVDENLEGFKGRVSRDRWVAQAKVIVEIGPEEFLKQVAAGREF